MLKMGVPRQVQWMLWMKMTHARDRRLKHPNMYEQLLRQKQYNLLDEQVMQQIKKDIPRTFPESEEFVKITSYMEWQRKREHLIYGHNIGEEFEQIKFVVVAATVAHGWSTH